MSLVQLGAALRRRGERVAAREPLRRALDLADAGVVSPSPRGRGRSCTVSGARVRRPALTGLDSLTPSERRIADLAARGLTNPEIAQTLFVTVKTVEMHLGNTYRKLDIHSRRDLARADPRTPNPGVLIPGAPCRGGRVAPATITPMHARLTTYENVDLALVDEVQRFVESQETQTPSPGLPGYAGSMTLVDRENARLVGIGFYESAGHARRPTRSSRGCRSAPARCPERHPARAVHAARQRRPLRGRAPRLTRGGGVARYRCATPL